jgi:hypothetical protein
MDGGGMKFKLVFVLAIFMALLISSCGSSSSDEFDIAVAVSLTQTAAAQIQQPTEPTVVVTAEQEAPATIKGTVRLMSFPTPSIVIYAMNPQTGEWVSTQTAPNDQEASFELSVPAGSYILYGFTEDGTTYVGYPSGDELDLGLLEIAPGEVNEYIYMYPPTPGDCGVMWGVPDSPDGRFAGFYASEACMRLNWAGGDYVVPSADLCQMMEGFAQETLGVPFELNMMDSFTDNITGESGSGCTILAQVTGDQLSSQTGVMEDLMNAFVGWEEDPMYQASGPTGYATALRRDMALMILSSSWEPYGVDCPNDQPIGACELTPAQKLFTIKIQIGMK